MKTIEFDKIDMAMEFYSIDKKYKERLYECARIINSNEEFNKKFFEIYDILFLDNSERYRDFQNCDGQTIDDFFVKGIDPFVTNLILILGFEVHDKNMKYFDLDENVVKRHKASIRYLYVECMEIKKNESISVGLMLWGVYYTRIDLVYVGRLQYQKYKVDGNKCIVKIHIPRDGKLNFDDVVKSINDSKFELKKFYGNYEFEYSCNSWLLSNQVYEIIDKDSNIARFRNLFDVQDRENCLEDILYFVFNSGLVSDYTVLQENTSLQRRIKQSLINGQVFYLGEGTLK